jgi:threonine/homoserine/homoserine lactone efflux protein
MILLVKTFIVAFVFSFLGTIPPGSLNLTMIQLGLDNKMSIAWRFALATSIAEYPYAWIAIKFESLITSSPVITDKFQLLTGIVMISLGAINLWSSTREIRVLKRFNESGFRRGFILGLLNPMAIPFWIAITAYLKSMNLVELSNSQQLHAYLIGVSLGTLLLLILLAYLAQRLVAYFQTNKFLKRLPGLTMVALGVYALVSYSL